MQEPLIRLVEVHVPQSITGRMTVSGRYAAAVSGIATGGDTDEQVGVYEMLHLFRSLVEQRSAARLFVR